MEKQNGYGCHLPSEYLFDKINITRQGDFGMYYIIGTTIYREPEAKFIYKDKLVYPYGTFPEELGYSSYHKAEVAMRKIDKAVNHSSVTRARDLVALKIEVHAPEEAKNH